MIKSKKYRAIESEAGLAPLVVSWREAKNLKNDLQRNFARSDGNRIVFEPEFLPAGTSVSAYDHLVDRVSNFALSFYFKLDNIVYIPKNLVSLSDYRAKHILKIERLSRLAVNYFMDYVKTGINYEK